MKKEWNKKIWIAKKIGVEIDDDGYEIPVFDKPIMYRMNVQPVSTQAEIAEFGEYATGMQKAVIDLKKYLNEFEEFDVAYLDGASPMQEGGDFVLNVSEVNMSRVKDINALRIENLAEDELKCYACKNANYRLYPPRNQNKAIILYFEKIAGR